MKTISLRQLQEPVIQVIKCKIIFFFWPIIFLVSFSTQMRLQCKFIVCLFWFAVAAFDSTLVIYDNTTNLQEYATFISIIKTMSESITFRTSNDYSDLRKPEIDAPYNFDSIVLMVGPLEEDAVASPNVTELLEFINFYGGNLFVATGSYLSDDLRELAQECGIEFEGRNSFIVDDHHEFLDQELNENLEDTICGQVYSGLSSSSSKLAKKTCVPFPRNTTVGMQIDKNNIFLKPIVIASKNAKSVGGILGDVEKSRDLGEKLSYVVALIAANQARVVFVGSQDMIKDSHLKQISSDSSKVSVPELFFEELVAWTLKTNLSFEMANCKVYSYENHEWPCSSSWHAKDLGVDKVVFEVVQTRQSNFTRGGYPNTGTSQINIKVRACQAAVCNLLQATRTENGETTIVVDDHVPSGWNTITVYASSTETTSLGAAIDAAQHVLIEFRIFVRRDEHSSPNGYGEIFICTTALVAAVMYLSGFKTFHASKD